MLVIMKTGTTIGVINGDTRSLDSSIFALRMLW